MSLLTTVEASPRLPNVAVLSSVPHLSTLEALWRLPPGWVKCCHRCLAGNIETPGCCEVDQVLLHLVVPLCCAEVEDCHHTVEVTWKTLENHRCEESIWDHFPRFSQIQFEPFCFGEVVSHLLPWCHLETSELCHQWLNTRAFSWFVELRQSWPGCSPIRLVPSDCTMSQIITDCKMYRSIFKVSFF